MTLLLGFYPKLFLVMKAVIRRFAFRMSLCFLISLTIAAKNVVEMAWCPAVEF